MTRRALGAAAVAAAVAGSLVLPLVLGGHAAIGVAAAFPIAGTAAILALSAASALARAVKFRLLAERLERRLGPASALAVSLGCDFAYLVTPGGLGGLPGSVYLFARAGIEPARGAAIAAADQVLDLLFFALAVPAAVLWMIATQPGFEYAGVPSVAAACVAAILGAGLTGCGFRATAARLGDAALRLPLLRRRRAAIVRWWRQTWLHLRELCAAGPARAAALLAATAAQWFARYAILGLAMAWAGHPMPFAAVLVVQAVALHAGQWTGVPGGVGGADLLVARALASWAPAASVGGVILAWRIATFHLPLAAGGLAFGLLALRAGSRRRGAALPAAGS